MPYERSEDLPEDVQDALPEHAQDIYREAFNSAWEQYEDPEKTGKEKRPARRRPTPWPGAPSRMRTRRWTASGRNGRKRRTFPQRWVPKTVEQTE